jgi:hypothetical protein
MAALVLLGGVGDRGGLSTSGWLANSVGIRVMQLVGSVAVHDKKKRPHGKRGRLV